MSMEMPEFQNRAAAWCIECFGRTTALDKDERNWRFLEEALELIQSLGAKAEDVHKMVDYVFERDPGDPPQEVGGTVVSLAALLAANGLSMYDEAQRELTRIEQPDTMNKIRAKHANKPHRVSLPDDYKHAT